jgi:hypothetical protein
MWHLFLRSRALGIVENESVAGSAQGMARRQPVDKRANAREAVQENALGLKEGETR